MALRLVASCSVVSKLTTFGVAQSVDWSYHVNVTVGKVAWKKIHLFSFVIIMLI